MHILVHKFQTIEELIFAWLHVNSCIILWWSLSNLATDSHSHFQSLQPLAYSHYSPVQSIQVNDGDHQNHTVVFLSIFFQCRACDFKYPVYYAHNCHFSAVMVWMASEAGHWGLITSHQYVLLILTSASWLHPFFWMNLMRPIVTVACYYFHRTSIYQHTQDDNNVAFLQRDFVTIQRQSGSFQITLATWFVALCDRLPFTRQHVNRWLSVAALLSLIIIRW